MAAVVVCDAMGWTFEEYMRQPNWFIDLLALKRQADNEYRQKQAKS